MINLTTQEIELGEKTFPIRRWETWFQTPVGIITDLKKAIGSCEAHDYPPTFIRPVPVAISDNDVYEVVT